MTVSPTARNCSFDGEQPCNTEPVFSAALADSEHERDIQYTGQLLMSARPPGVSHPQIRGERRMWTTKATYLHDGAVRCPVPAFGPGWAVRDLQVDSGRREFCHLITPPCKCIRCFNRDKQGVSVE